MKKLLALMLTLLLVCSCALAELMEINPGKLLIDVGDLTVYELTDEDLEEDIVLWFGNAETLDAVVYAFEEEGTTLDDVMDYMTEYSADTITSSGMMDVNGLEVFCMEETDEEGNHYLSYFLTPNDSVVQITFWYDGQQAARLANDVVSTLVKKPSLSTSSFMSNLGSMFSNALHANADDDDYDYDDYFGITEAKGVTAIDRSSLRIDLSGMYLLTLDQDDKDDDMVLWFVNDEETLDCCVWVYTADGYTLADMANELAESGDECTSCGYTTINGIEAYYWVGPDDGDTLVEYFIIDGKMIVQLSFDCEDDAALQLSGQIMNTLSK